MELSLELLQENTAHRPLESVESLDLSEKNISSLSVTILCRINNLQTLDLSGNRLSTFPSEATLKNLKKLNLKRNEIQDFSFLSNYSSIEELFIEGNPLRSSDIALIIALLPNLRNMDIADFETIREEIEKLDDEITKAIDDAFDVDSLSADYTLGLNQRKIEEKLMEKVRSAGIEFSDCLQKAFEHKLRIKAKVKIEEEFIKLKACLEEIAQSNSDEKKIQEKDENGNITKRNGESKIDKSGPKKKRIHLEEKLDYDAMLFIRCHSSQNDPYDSSTQVWKTAFAPTLKESNPCKLVASCGGNIVCLIDCETAKVKKRYCDSNANERFCCLAWTAIKSDNATNVILAVGGSEKQIVLLSDDLTCLCKFRAHEKDVNALLFHPLKVTWLLSGGYDQFINLWNIEPADDEYKVELLKAVNSHNFLLQLAFSPEFDVLLAAGENGLTFWPNFETSVSNPLVPQLGYTTFTKYKLIDGMAIFPEYKHLVALKRSQTGVIDVINLKTLLEEFSKALIRNKIRSLFTRTPFRSFFQFDYCKMVTDYVYLALEKGMMVCGDEKGRLWIYDTRNIPVEPKGEQKMPSVQPTLILKWPAINNPTHNQKKIVEEKNQIINAVAISSDLTYIVAATNINLVCLWKRTDDSS